MKTAVISLAIHSSDISRSRRPAKDRAAVSPVVSRVGRNLSAQDEARRFYALTVEVLGSLPGNQYRRTIRDAVERALERVR
jgi:hypothetical protein